MRVMTYWSEVAVGIGATPGLEVVGMAARPLARPGTQ